MGLGFWYYFYTWAGSHSNQIDDEQVRYYLWFFDHAKTLEGLTMAILTLSESQSLLTGGRKRRRKPACQEQAQQGYRQLSCLVSEFPLTAKLCCDALLISAHVGTCSLEDNLSALMKHLSALMKHLS